MTQSQLEQIINELRPFCSELKEVYLGQVHNVLEKYLSSPIDQMTHTLHPEIEKILDAITLDYFLQSGEAGKKIDYKQRMKDKIVKYLGPYLHMPQPIENGIDKQDNNTLEYKYVSKSTGLPFISMEPLNLSDERELVTKPKDKEPLPEKCIHRFFLSHSGVVDLYTCHFCGIQQEKSEMEDDLKQSTPQIEKIDMDKLNMMLYAGSDSEGNSWSSDIPGAIKMLADYINNNLPPNKSNDQ